MNKKRYFKRKFDFRAIIKAGRFLFALLVSFVLFQNSLFSETMPSGNRFLSISPFKLIDVSPLIFSPDEADSSINRVEFHYRNPNYSEVDIRIYNVEGRLVRKNLIRLNDNIVYWDGRDENGRVSPMGVYIYNVSVDGINIAGLVKIAK